MLNPKSKSYKAIHKVFNILPQSCKLMFGNCRDTCTRIGLEDNIHKISSLKARLHIMVCRQCWKYYNQMTIVDEKIQSSIEKSSDEFQGQYDQDQLSETSLIEKYSK